MNRIKDSNPLNNEMCFDLPEKMAFLIGKTHFSFLKISYTPVGRLDSHSGGVKWPPSNFLDLPLVVTNSIQCSSLLQRFNLFLLHFFLLRKKILCIIAFNNLFLHTPTNQTLKIFSTCIHNILMPIQNMEMCYILMF